MTMKSPISTLSGRSILQRIGNEVAQIRYQCENGSCMGLGGSLELLGITFAHCGHDLAGLLFESLDSRNESLATMNPADMNRPIKCFTSNALRICSGISKEIFHHHALPIFALVLLLLLLLTPVKIIFWCCIEDIKKPFPRIAYL